MVLSKDSRLDMNTYNFSQFKLDNIGEFELFIRYDTPRFIEFTHLLNAKIDAMPIGGTLLVKDCTSLPKQYNLTVKWMCWRSFLSRHNISRLDAKSARKAVRYDMLPDYSGIKATYAKNTL